MSDLTTLEEFDEPTIRSFWNYLISTSSKLPPHYSPTRDIALRRAVIQNEFLASIINTVQYKLLGIPLLVQSKDTFVGSHLKLATQYNDVLQRSLYADDTFEKFIFDTLVCDNGGFLFLFNEFDAADQPLSSPPTNLIHLDSIHVQRTGRYNHPYLYLHTDNNWYPLHRSRVINITQMPSSDRELLGVGYSNASRLFSLVTHLYDLTEYEDEMISGLDAESILYATGARSDELEAAFKKAEIASINEGRRKLGKRVYLGVKDPQAKIGKFNLKSLPDNFDKRNDIEITLTLVSLACGGNPDWFYSAIKSGSTKASSNTAERIGESKVLTWWINKIKNQFIYKFCPPSLIITTGELDDIDGTRSQIQLNESIKRQNNITAGVTNIRTERELLVASGELSQIQFENLELQDGRLENGLPIESIFSTKETTMKKLIYFVENPLDFENNQYDEIKPKLIEAIKNAESLSINGMTIQTQRYGRQALYALKWVLDRYEEQENESIDSPDIIVNTDDKTDYQDELNKLDNPNVQKPIEDLSNDNNQEDNINKSFTTIKNREIRKEFRKLFKTAWKDKSKDYVQPINYLALKYLDTQFTDADLAFLKEDLRLPILYKYLDELLLEFL